jgi:hypothetical protein
LFWTLIGIGVLIVLVAAAWRVATGAELEAKGQEWSLKVTKAADTLDEARKQLEEEANRLKDELAKRDAFWAAQVTAVREACPKPIAAVRVQPPPPRTTGTTKALGEVAKTTDSARAAAREISKIRVPKLRF